MTIQDYPERERTQTETQPGITAAMSPYTDCPDSGVLEWRQWLPSINQMENALRLNLAAAIDGEAEEQAELGNCPATTMREGIGLIALAGLIAGFIPFLVNWFVAARWGTVAPFVGLVRDANQITIGGVRLVDSTGVIAGMESWLPAWLAAGLSALGVWISMPLHWLAIWILYGLGVLLFSHFLGATTTLQRFYGGVSYAALPLALLALTPIPWIGPLIGLVALVWAFIIYVRAVQVVADLDVGRAVLSILLPFVFMVIISLFVGLGIAMLTMFLFAF